tara:strand:+ start:478 stop:819 length:342 start_codon:yes stop_codon:yes gene_type:complete
LPNKGGIMKFVWKIPKNGDPTFEDKIHNIACFEVVLNILRMKCKMDDDVSDEVQALCGFALNCMFDDNDLDNEDMFEAIMDLKDKQVGKFRNKIFKDMGISEPSTNNSQIGEA